MIELTPAEARVLYTALHNMWSPVAGFDEFRSGVTKLCQIGGGLTCRNCAELGTRASRYGGFLCARHKEEEDARFVTPGE